MLNGRMRAVVVQELPNVCLLPLAAGSERKADIMGGPRRASDVVVRFRPLAAVTNRE
jgi:hypothetical protein